MQGQLQSMLIQIIVLHQMENQELHIEQVIQ